MDFEETTSQPLALNEVIEIDTICENFDRNWEPQKTSSIGRLIADVSPRIRSELLHELLFTDLEKRERKGCRKTSDFYFELLPEYRPSVVRASEAAFDSGCGPLELEIGRYRIRDQIGKGGMGRVYRAFDSELKREVAIKTLHPHAASNSSRLKRFINEITSVANLSHPNIVTLHDVVPRGSTTCAVMELLTGEDLSKRLLRGKLPLSRALSIFDGVAEGLGLAHSKGIVHRDIKPANIFLTEDGNAKILDFGIARLRDDVQAEFGTLGDDTDIGMIVGSIAYMSPEQVRGQPVDARSDIFLLGVVLHEMITGRNTFRKPQIADTRAAILTQAPEFEATDSIPKPVQELVRRCLEKEPEKRFQTIDELRDSTAVVLRDSNSTNQTMFSRSKLAFTFAITAALCLMAAAWLLPASDATTPDIATQAVVVESLAVLPFLGETDGGYEKENLTFSLTNSLSRLDDVSVRPFSLVYNSYQDELPLPLQKIADELEVDAVVTGIVNSNSRDELSIHVELYDPSNNRLIWGGDFQCKADELLVIQNTIATEIGMHLGPGTSTGEASIAEPLTENLAAFEQFVLGQVALSERRPQSVRRAIASFKQSVELDPDFESAYVGLANCFIVQSERNIVKPKEGYEVARMYAQRALDLDPESIDAQISMAMIEFEFDCNFAAAEKLFRRALNVDGSQTGQSQLVDHPTGHQWYAELLSATGRYESALDEIRIAQSQEPTSAIIESVEGLIHLKADKFVLATEKLTKVLDKYPTFDRARGYLIDVFETTQQLERALIQWTALAKSNQQPIDLLKRGYDGGGKEGYWSQRLQQDYDLSKIRAVSPLFRAHVLIQNNEEEQAIKLIRQLKEDKNGALAPNLLVHPFFKSLRKDPEWGRLLQEMGFDL